jgi:hypothetical protein
MPMKRRTPPDLMLAVADRVLPAIEQGGKTSLAVRQWQRHQMSDRRGQQVEDEIDEASTAPSFRRVLDQREGNDAIRPEPAKFAVEIAYRAGKVWSAAAIAGYLPVSRARCGSANGHLRDRAARACMR